MRIACNEIMQPILLCIVVFQKTELLIWKRMLASYQIGTQLFSNSANKTKYLGLKYNFSVASEFDAACLLDWNSNIGTHCHYAHTTHMYASVHTAAV